MYLVYLISIALRGLLNDAKICIELESVDIRDPTEIGIKLTFTEYDVVLVDFVCKC